MRIIETSKLTPKTPMTPDDTSWAYNGLDCCVTLEVQRKLRQHLEDEPENVRETYATAMRKLAPVNFMTVTGLKVDHSARSFAIAQYRNDLERLESRWKTLCTEVLGYPVNWRSPVQLNQLFYSAMRLKPVRKRDSKGNFRPTTNADALERFQIHFYAQVFSRYILAMREVGKRISFLESSLDEDGRMRTELNIAGTDTGRFSSSFSAFGTGTNLQNVENRLRSVFIPDDGYIFVNVDLSQADARNVGARIYEIFYDSHGPEEAGKYLDACESGDLHTTVTGMTWKELGIEALVDAKLKREAADTIFVGSTSYRDMAKKLGHGTNYYGLPKTMAGHTKTEVSIIEDFQRRYFRAFPLIGNYEKDLEKNDWHGWVYRQLRDHAALTTLFGRRRIFFDRYKELTTLRAAIAYEPQSMTGEELDRGWLQLWDGMPEARLQVPVHDSILFQLPFEGLHELLPRALKLLEVWKELRGGRMFHVPLEAKIGWNWADSKKDKKTGLWQNEYGLRVWTGKEERTPPKRSKTLVRLLG